MERRRWARASGRKRTIALLGAFPAMVSAADLTDDFELLIAETERRPLRLKPGDVALVCGSSKEALLRAAEAQRHCPDTRVILVEDAKGTTATHLLDGLVVDSVLMAPVGADDLRRSIEAAVGEPSGSRVLVVSPDGRDPVPLHRLLAGAGVRTAVAGGSQAALAYCKRHPEIGVAIVDLEDAPVASGFAAGLPQGAECTILAVAPRGLSSSAPDAVPGAARDIIVRPVDAPELVWRVQRLLAQAGTRGRALGARPVLLETHNAAMREALDLLHRLAATDKTVLLRGETGTGKEVLARTLHDWSERRERPFLAVNCAAIPDSLLATELYGHERGAFTGALRTKRGLVELAKGGTLFLDEIGELSPAMQAALLRVLQEGEFMRVGGEEVLRSDVRIVAATHRDLEEMVAKSLFREDLYYRIQIVPIHVPALRERPEDLRALADFVARRSAEEQHTPERRFTPAAYAELERHSWPGNIRELENVVARALLLSTGPEIDWIKLDRDRRPLSAPPPARAPADREALVDLIRQHQGNIKAAAAAGRIPRRTFYRRLQALGIEPQSLRRNG